MNNWMLIYSSAKWVPSIVTKNRNQNFTLPSQKSSLFNLELQYFVISMLKRHGAVLLVVRGAEDDGEAWCLAQNWWRRWRWWWWWWRWCCRRPRWWRNCRKWWWLTSSGAEDSQFWYTKEHSVSNVSSRALTCCMPGQESRCLISACPQYKFWTSFLLASSYFPHFS